MEKLNRIIYYFLLLVYVLVVWGTTNRFLDGSPADIAIHAFWFVACLLMGIMHWRRQYQGLLYWFSAMLYLVLTGPRIFAGLGLLSLGYYPVFLFELILYAIPLLHIAFNLCRAFSYAALWIAGAGILVTASALLFALFFIKDPVKYPYPDLMVAAETYFSRMQWLAVWLYAGIFIISLGLLLFARQKTIKARPAVRANE